MALLNFQKRFVPHIEDGTKRHTIRATRKTPFKVGEMLHLYTGLRQKGAQLLFRAPCVKVEEIAIRHDTKAPSIIHVFIDGERLDECEKRVLAERDGFRAGPDSFEEMMRFWEGRLPFRGQIVHWDYDRRTR